MGLFGFGKPKEEKILDLQVLEAYSRDEVSGTISIDWDTLDLLGSCGQYSELSPDPQGYFIEINNDPFENETKLLKKKITAKFSALYPSDEGKGIIRINHESLVNGKIHLNSIVSIKRVPAYFAEVVTCTPLDKRVDTNSDITAVSEYVRSERVKYTVYKNQIFWVGMQNLPFKVISVAPIRKSGSYALVVNEHTRFVIVLRPRQ